MIEREIDVAAITDSVWRAHAHRALEFQGEMLAVYYMAYGAGHTQWHLLRTGAELDAFLAIARQRDQFDLYLTRLLPLRGMADAQLEASVIHSLRDCGEVLLTSAPSGPTDMLPTRLDHMGADEESDVRDWFSEHRGRNVLAGPHPASLPDGPEFVLSGRMPDPDGKVRSAAF